MYNWLLKDWLGIVFKPTVSLMGIYCWKYIVCFMFLLDLFIISVCTTDCCYSCIAVDLFKQTSKVNCWIVFWVTVTLAAVRNLATFQADCNNQIFILSKWLVLKFCFQSAICLCVTLTNSIPESQGTTNNNVIMHYKCRFNVGICTVTGVGVRWRTPPCRRVPHGCCGPRLGAQVRIWPLVKSNWGTLR